MSGFYIGVDGVARKVKGGYIGVDGVARKIKKGYIGDENGVARLCWTSFDGDPVFANNTWEKIVEACQTGNVPSTWNVGDSKTMTIGGSNYTIDIIGKNHDDYSDGSGKAPLTFQLHGVYESYYTMNVGDNNGTGWASSNMRQTVLKTVLDAMPTGVRTAIKDVRKATSVGSASSTITNTVDKLFFPSEIEVFGNTNNSFAGEGAWYEYYKVNSAAKKYGTDARKWWLRSPYKGNKTSFVVVNTNGTATYSAANETPVYISPAFCF